MAQLPLSISIPKIVIFLCTRVGLLVNFYLKNSTPSSRKKKVSLQVRYSRSQGVPCRVAMLPRLLSLALLFTVVESGGHCNEQAAAASACKNGNSGTGGNFLYQCILMQGGSCKAAIKTLLAKKNVPACKDDAERMQKAIGMCNTIMHGCPELKGLGACYRGFIDHPKQKCTVIKLTSCNRGIYALLAKEKAMTNAGCKKLAQTFRNDMKVCKERPSAN